jgi:hypothetical protein
VRTRTLPKHPFRDSAILYAVFTVVAVALLVITDGNLIVGIPLVVGCFVLATGYSWWQIRKQLEAEEAET